MNNQNREKVIQLIIVVVIMVSILQLFNLQIIKQEYKQVAENNTIYRKVIYPARGIVYDIKKRGFLENRISYDLEVTPSEVKNFDTSLFCSIIQITKEEFKKRMLELIIKNTSVKPSIFEAVLPKQIYSKLFENIYKFEGFDLVERTVRYYPTSTGAHLLGYLAEVDSSFLRKNRELGYELGDYVGVSGLEKEYESSLKGQKGINRLFRDNKGRLQGSYEDGKYDTVPVNGKNLYIGVDLEVQALAEQLLHNKIGSVVAINPKNGSIIAMASSPTYNPNLLIGPHRRRAYISMLYDTTKPLYNRAIKGMYPPGSTFKPLGGLLALGSRTITPEWGYPCTGNYYGCGAPRNCEHKNPGHANNLVQALANSCNSYFLQIFRNMIDNNQFGSVEKGYQRWKDYVNEFGLGEYTDIDIPGENKGSIYTVEQYRNDFKTDDWNSCFLLTLGIGQDRMTTTPVQLAKLTSIIANKGYYYIPHFVDSIENETEAEKKQIQKYRTKNVINDIPQKDYDPIIEGMYQVTKTGTASFIKVPGIEYCAKTGTAQNPHGKNHSIFICFAPKDNPKIAVAVIVENAGFGSTWAGPIGAFIIEKFLNDTIATSRLADLKMISEKVLIPEQVMYSFTNRDSSYNGKNDFDDNSFQITDINFSEIAPKVYSNAKPNKNNNKLKQPINKKDSSESNKKIIPKNMDPK
ncbi:MAG: penicillin-binding protein 2, partial [Sediminibacterium sp.]|nr:penicillin-binding protein 2 [Sediminibacterium sp.]